MIDELKIFFYSDEAEDSIKFFREAALTLNRDIEDSDELDEQD